MSNALIGRGGRGGSAPFGGAGGYSGSVQDRVGKPGKQPGGGGGGAYTDNSAEFAGGIGAPGAVIITW